MDADDYHEQIWTNVNNQGEQDAKNLIKKFNDDEYWQRVYIIGMLDVLLPLRFGFKTDTTFTIQRTNKNTYKIIFTDRRKV